MKAGSEFCYLFVEVTDALAGIQDTETIAEQLTANGWKTMSGNVWYLETAVDARTVAQDVAVFTYFKVKGTADVSGFATQSNTAAIIKVTAYAVQADGFASATAAWNAAYGAPANP